MKEAMWRNWGPGEDDVGLKTVCEDVGLVGPAQGKAHWRAVVN